MKKVLALLLSILLLGSLVGCGEPEQTNNSVVVMATRDEERTEIETEELTDAPTDAPTEEPTEAQTEPTQTVPADYVNSIWLTDLEYIKKGDVEIAADTTDKTNTGTEFSHFMYSKSPYSEIVYNLNGDYEVLSAVWAIRFDNRNSEANNDFEIYSDNKLIYSSKTITSNDIPEDITVDISGCRILTIIFKQGHGDAALAEIELSNNTQKVKNPVDDFISDLPCWLTELSYFRDNGVVIQDDTGVANTGETYSHYYFCKKPGNEIVYYLNGLYEKLTGLWTICNYNKNITEQNSFEIYADDKLVYTSPKITGKDTPVKVEAKINNCVLLRIVFRSGNGAGEFANVRVYPGGASKPVNPSLESLIGDGDWLTELDYLSNKNVTIINDTTGISNTGDTYSHYLYGNSDSEIVYYLKGEYASISGVWAICKDGRDNNETNAFVIYADDTLIYSSPKISAGDFPVSFEQDIKKCQKLRIVFTEGRGSAKLGNLKIK